LGVLQRALRDLSAWCEKGVAPAASTHYKIEDGQVIVPPTAAARRGVQPVVNLTINGNKRINTTAGKIVRFTAVVEVPTQTGKIVAAEWDFEGKGTFSTKVGNIVFDEKTGRTTLKISHKFTKQGTFFPTVRVAAQREGDAKTPFARIQNLDRVRVVVE
jgi:hypothetical protein